MTNEIISKKSKNFKLNVKKPKVIAKERKSKILNDLIRHKESNIWVVNNYKFSKNWPRTKTNEC